MKLSTLILLSALVPSTASASLPVIADDYTRAQAEAKQRHLPLFVDVWAPW
jgi:hypothetical protein